MFVVAIPEKSGKFKSGFGALDDRPHSFFTVRLPVYENEGFDHRHHQVDKSPNKQIIGKGLCFFCVSFKECGKNGRSSSTLHIINSRLLTFFAHIQLTDMD